ncbi:ATP-binding cassette domain-containing protein [Erythrobacter sp. HA6-11]
MIKVQDLHKAYPTRFGEKTVLRGINFQLGRGERLGILGRNGAGKSTLIRLVSGAEKPTSGTIESSMSVSWPLAFGGAFQPHLTGVDNVRFITSIYDQDFDRNIAFVEEFAELGPYLKEPVRTYSSGMRARLAFAISMIIEFDCFLIDEIGAVGDARFHDRCNHELFQVRGDRAMIIISHDAGYVREHCNRWAVLHDGELTQFSDFEEAYESYKELIGANSRAEPQPVSFANRTRMVESSQHAALSDERFRAITQQADWARDKQQWERAAEYYANALALYPYQRSYWVQLGHMRKELGEFAAAEVAYRTSVALGEPLADVEPHVEYVVREQAGDYYYSRMHLPSDGPASTQPPTQPDVEWLNLLLTGKTQLSTDELLNAQRLFPDLDSLCASLIAEQPAPATNQEFEQHDTASLGQLTACQFGDNLSDNARELLSQSSASPAELLAVLQSHEAFVHWPKTKTALAAHNPQLAA